MTEVAKIVRDALVQCGQLDATEAPSAEDMADGISALNRMMRGFEVEGLNLGWHDVSSPAEEAPIPPEAEEAVIYNLAMRFCGAYGLEPREVDIAVARSGLSTLRVLCTINDFARVKYPDLPVGNRQRSGSWQDGFTH